MTERRSGRLLAPQVQIGLTPDQSQARGDRLELAAALDLFRPEAEDELVVAGEELKALGARGIMLACTGLATIGIAPKLRERLGIPIFDPLRCAIGAIYSVLWTEEQ